METPRRNSGRWHVCTGGKQCKAQKENGLVSGLQDHRYLSVTEDETRRCQWAGPRPPPCQASPRQHTASGGSLKGNTNVHSNAARVCRHMFGVGIPVPPTSSPTCRSPARAGAVPSPELRGTALS